MTKRVSLPLIRRTANENWCHWITSKSAHNDPVHRWFLFPHSFSGQVVDFLLDQWKLRKGSTILDPFVGTGTTLLSSQLKLHNAIGYDLSPLSVFVSNAKTARYSKKINEYWRELDQQLDGKVKSGIPCRSDILSRAFGARHWDVLQHIAYSIADVRNPKYKSFFQLALIRILHTFSKAKPSGGWLRWTSTSPSYTQVLPQFRQSVESMLCDVSRLTPPKVETCRAYFGDARNLPRPPRSIDAVITSPPYPNRHDYSRIFNIELSFAFLSDFQVQQFRRNSFRSHVEAKTDHHVSEFIPSETLKHTVARVEERCTDRRIPRMIEGYFEDMYLHLRAVRDVLVKRAPLAYILGNVRYHGIEIPVDQMCAEIAISLGFTVKQIKAVRYRGNSAQQMGIYGRHPSRESILMMVK